MKKKEIKKRRKAAIKDICNNTFVIGKFRDIFNMRDYDREEVAELIKTMIKEFIENGYDDPGTTNLIRAAKSRGRDDIVASLRYPDSYEEDEYDDYEDGYESNPKIITPKVNKKSKNSRVSSFFK